MLNYNEILKLKHPLTEQQSNVLDWVVNGEGNAVLKAVAGGGKTFILQNTTKLINHFNLGNAIYLAFNKAIVKEASTKLECEVTTLHSKGYSVLRSNFGSIKVDSKYVNSIVNEKRKNWLVGNGNKTEDYNYGRAIMELISKSKMNLITPKQFTHQILKDLMVKYNISPKSEALNDVTFVTFYDRFLSCYQASLPKHNGKQYSVKKINFDDMIFLPSILPNLTFPKYSWVLIDECQDLNAAQRNLMLRLVSESGRFLSVGDEFQAIYRFAGADAQSYQELVNLPNTVELELTNTFRCGKNIVKEAQKYVPHINAFELNGDGEVSEGSINDAKYDDIILCRINAPLVELCLQYIAKGKKAIVRGKDIGTNLISLIKKFKLKEWNTKTSLEVLETHLEHHSTNILNELSFYYPDLPRPVLKGFTTYQNFYDKWAAITAISQTVDNISQLVSKIETIFKEDTDGILLSSIHKAKGLEFDNVFILHRELFDSFYKKNMALGQQEAAQQEHNLHYVAITRAVNRFITINDWTSSNKLIEIANKENEKENNTSTEEVLLDNKHIS